MLDKWGGSWLGTGFEVAVVVIGVDGGSVGRGMEWGLIWRNFGR